LFQSHDKYYYSRIKNSISHKTLKNIKMLK
jgi:hypothetical protein